MVGAYGVSTEGTSYLIFGRQNHQCLGAMMLALEIETEKRSRLAHPKLYIQPQRTSDLSVYKIRDIRSGVRRVMREGGEAVLDALDGYLLLVGEIIWDLSIVDPLVDGRDVPS